MKKIEAIIRPVKFEDVKAALAETGYGGITVTEVEGHGTQKGFKQVWRGREYKVDLLPKIKLEIVCPDKEAVKLIKAILRSAWTGQAGDGKIFVYDIVEAYRISSGEEGEKVLFENQIPDSRTVQRGEAHLSRA
ncbi:MAG TPA: P-II family nitrogen regulator [bacterium]|jgi:nitrogen regulatory protein P-II 1|nr:P-II family nitrogen regulator [bacterium]